MKKRPDICFVTSPNYWTSEHLPYYFLQLSAWLEREGLKTEIVDIKREKLHEDFMLARHSYEYIESRIIKRVLEIRPKSVGFSVFITDYSPLMKLARKIKDACDVPIIVGNAQATLCPEDFLFDGSPIDYLVIGEGEVTLTELLNKKERTGIKGIAFFDNGSIRINEPRELLQDLSVLPIPAYEKVRMESYLRPTPHLIRGSMISGVAVFTGRGCPFNCSFCAANAVWKKNTGGKPFRYRPVSAVIDEITYLKKKYSIDGFYIVDDTFTLERKRVESFCRELTRRRLRLVWACQTRVNLIDDKLAKAMKNAGCVQLEFGVETGSPRLLKKINKAVTVSQIKRAFKICEENGIRSFANMLVNLPGETLNDLKDSEKLLSEINPTVSAFGITQPYPGSKIYDEHFKGKLNRSDYALFSDRAIDIPVFRMSAHNINFEKIIARWTKKFRTRGQYDFLINPYWRAAVMRSKRKRQYLYEIIRQSVLSRGSKIINKLFPKH